MHVHFQGRWIGHGSRRHRLQEVHRNPLLPLPPTRFPNLSFVDVVLFFLTLLIRAAISLP
jgi:hypothetical protein